jgi:hypothetical protein
MERPPWAGTLSVGRNTQTGGYYICNSREVLIRGISSESTAVFIREVLNKYTDDFDAWEKAQFT